ncbi:MAG: chloride channel protein, partial [Euryarchaeota archaeon]|nr:chloride channel protein [Euryarchaeota archaeon]
AAGGLLAGIIIYTYAPEAEGHGTDAVIDAYNNKRGFIRKRVPLIKAIGGTYILWDSRDIMCCNRNIVCNNFLRIT